MAHTFVFATTAGQRTGLEHQFHNTIVKTGTRYYLVPSARQAPDRQSTGCNAYVCAVQIHIDTVAQLVESFFAKAGIGADPACESAIETCIGSQNQNIIGLSVNPGVGA
jgi:hypothetical protein